MSNTPDTPKSRLKGCDRMDIEIIGLDELRGKMESLGESAAASLERSMGEAIMITQAQAKLLCPVDEGDLRNSIHSKAESDGETVTGTVYTNSDHAAYVEFGTGPRGAADHAGVSPDVEISYKSGAWWIPEGPNGIDAKTAKKYHFPAYMIDGKTYYRCEGQAAQPFMYPAIQQTKRIVAKKLQELVSAEIAKAVDHGKS